MQASLADRAAIRRAKAGPPGGELFESDPYHLLERRLGIVRPGALNLSERALFAGLFAWGPLLALTLMSGGDANNFFRDAAVHARYLIAVPLLVMAEGFCARQLTSIARHFRGGRFVVPADAARFDAVLARTGNALRSVPTTLVVLGLVVVLVASLWAWVPRAAMPRWMITGTALTPAGLWHLVVSLPLLGMLIFGWGARIAVWGWFLVQVSRLELRVIPAHPDHAGGLGFVGGSATAFAGVGFAIGSVLAGRLVNDLLNGETIGAGQILAVGIVAVGLIAAFTAPLLAFTPLLIQRLGRGLLDYGVLATDAGEELEAKWITGEKKPDTDLLDSNAFSAMTDLNSVVASVQAMRIVPLDLMGVAILLGGVLLPFVPVVFLSIPTEVLLDALRTLFP